MSARRAAFGLSLALMLVFSACQLFVDNKVQDPINPKCTVKGTITLADGTTPVAGAKVVVTYRTTYSMLSNADGTYALDVPMKTFDNDSERATFYVYYRINNYFQASITLQKNTVVPQDVKLAGNQDLGAGQVITGSIDTASDEKWFSFNAKYDQIYRVALTMPECTVQPFVEIFSEKPFNPVPQLHNEQSRMLWSGYTPVRSLDSGNRAITLGLATDPATPYYIRVTDATRQNADKNVQFTMTVIVKDMPDDHELANNFNAGAQLLVPDQPPSAPTYYDRIAYIAYIADKDWYKVHVGKTKILRVDYTQAASNIAPHVFLYTDVRAYAAEWDTVGVDHNPLIWWHGTTAKNASSILSSGNRGVMSDPNPPDIPGDWYVMIHDNLDVNFDDATPYELKYYILDKQKDEPANDDQTTAPLVASGVQYDGYLDFINDIDNIRVNDVIAPGRLIKVDVTSDYANTGTVIPKASLVCDAPPAWHDTMSFPSKPTLSSGNRAILSSGGGYVIINNDNDAQSDYHKQYDYDHQYHVTITVKDAPDKAWEPLNNDWLTTQRDLTSGSSNSASDCYIAAVADKDWFKWTGITKGQDVRVTMSSAQTRIVPHMELYREKNGQQENLISKHSSYSALVASNYNHSGPVSLDSLNRGFEDDGILRFMVKDDSETLWEDAVPYTVTVTVITPGDVTFEATGNNTSGTAAGASNQLASGVPATNRYISHIGDEDWYSILNVTQGKTVDVSVTMNANSDINGTLNITAELWNTPGSSMVTSSVTTAATSGSSDTKTISYFNASGTYSTFLIRLRDSGSDHCSSVASYSLTATVH